MSNPFAYYEESLPVRQAEIGFNESADSGEGTSHEPRVPIVLPLKRGMFGGHTTLEATRDQCEISGESLAEPIVVSREEAANGIKVKSNKLIIRTDDGRKYSFRYRRDKQRELMLARLETWRRQRWHDAAAGAYESVSELLKKHVIRITLHNMIALTVLQGLPVLIMLLFMLAGLLTGQMPGGTEILLFALVGTLFYAIPPTVTLALSVALWMRQIWALYATIILSFVPLGIGILGLFGFIIQATNPVMMNDASFLGAMIFVMVIIILISVAVVGGAVWAILRYNALKATLEYDNRG